MVKVMERSGMTLRIPCGISPHMRCPKIVTNVVVRRLGVTQPQLTFPLGLFTLVCTCFGKFVDGKDDAFHADSIDNR